MKRIIRISKDLTLPMEAVTETFGILAKRGAGKTYTAKVMAEEMLKNGSQVAVLDPLGAWWGLRASADGRGPGLPILVMGGDHGDVPLTEDSGSIIADLVASDRVSVVVDLSHFRKAARRRFTTAFAERLFEKNRHPLHLFIDEADAFAPQRPMPDEARMLGALEDIVRRGRIKGIGCSLITQRSAVLNKDVLTQIEVLVVLRTTAHHDIKAMDAWIENHDSDGQRQTVKESLASLDIGTAWFWSPGWLRILKKIRVRELETFDSSATPRVGQKIRQPKKLAPVDVERIRGKIQDTIKLAEESDPTALRRRIAGLEADKLRLERAPKKERVVDIKTPLLTKKESQMLRSIEVDLHRLAKVFESAAPGLTAAQADIKDLKERILSRREPPQLISRPSPAKTPAKIGPVGKTYIHVDGENNGLLKGERRMLEVLARRHPLKLTRTQLGTLSGLTASGGTFGNYFGRLKRRGLVIEQGGEVLVTEAGMSQAGEVPKRPQTMEEILEMWRGNLLAGERRMLDALVEAMPKVLTKEELGKRVNITYTGGTFANYLGTLRRNGLAEVNGQDVAVGAALFLGQGS